MKPFRFRAQAALELRRRQDELAQRALAEARAAVALAEQTLIEARAQVRDAMRAGSEADGTAADVSLLAWHRNWIRVRQRAAMECEKQLDHRRGQAREATLRALEARRRLRTLERLRGRAWHAYQADARRREQKELDGLGALQFCVRQLQQESTP